LKINLKLKEEIGTVEEQLHLSCSRCKSKAKEYRRYKRASSIIATMEKELKNNWGEGWEKQSQVILIPQNKGGGKK